jgi:hypothetical protein
LDVGWDANPSIANVRTYRMLALASQPTTAWFNAFYASCEIALSASPATAWSDRHEMALACVKSGARPKMLQARVRQAG